MRVFTASQVFLGFSAKRAAHITTASIDGIVSLQTGVCSHSTAQGGVTSSILIT